MTVLDRTQERITRGWVGANAQVIEKNLALTYGVGWRKCFPPTVQKALLDAEVLRLINSQALPKYEPAQAIIRAFAEYWEPTDEPR